MKKPWIILEWSAIVSSVMLLVEGIPADFTKAQNRMDRPDVLDTRRGPIEKLDRLPHFDHHTEPAHEVPAICLGREITPSQKEACENALIRNLWKIVLYETGVGLWNGVKETVKKLNSRAVKVKDKLKVAAVDFAAVAMEVGKKVIKAPLRGLQSIVHSAGSLAFLAGKKVATTVKAIPGAVFGKGVKAVGFPGSGFVLSFPSKLNAVVDPLKNSVFTIYQGAKRSMNAAKAITIYKSLDILFKIIGPVMRKLKLDCIRFQGKSIDVKPVISMRLKEGMLCGLTHLVAHNKVTVTRDNAKFLIVVVPFSVENVTLDFKNVTVKGVMGNLLEDVSVQFSIENFEVLGEISFEAWTLMKFVTIKLRVSKLAGFKLKFTQVPGGKGFLMNIMERLSLTLKEDLKDQINSALKMVERLVSLAIANGTITEEGVAMKNGRAEKFDVKPSHEINKKLGLQNGPFRFLPQAQANARRELLRLPAGSVANNSMESSEDDDEWRDD